MYEALVRFINSRPRDSLVRTAAREGRLLARRARFASKTRRAIARFKECRVNLGCGEAPTPGWVNLDTRLLPGTLFWDCRRRLPFADGSVIALYTEHMFEHFDVDSEARPFLKECMRCLKPGGVLRIVVPDAGRYLRAYGGPWQPLVEMKPLTAEGSGWRDDWLEATYETQMQVINAVFRQNYEHKYAYDEETLTLMLRRSGFSRVIRQEFGVSADPMMAPDCIKRRVESLYVEAIK